MAYQYPTAGAAREALASDTSLGGVTADAAEVNKLDGYTGTQLQLQSRTVHNIVEATSSGDVTLTSTQTGSWVFPTLASTVVMTVTLPAAAAGLEFTFFSGTTVQFIVKPAGTDLLPLGTGVIQTTGLGIASILRNQSIRLVALATGRWFGVGGIATTGWAAT